MASYSVVLLAAAAVVMTLAWSCHHQPAESSGFACAGSLAHFRGVALFGLIIVGHSLASALAVIIAPDHRRATGLVAVLLPVVALSLAMRNTVTGDYDIPNDVLPIILLGIPTAVCTWLVVRKVS